jgi:hypothetical protein
LPTKRADPIGGYSELRLTASDDRDRSAIGCECVGGGGADPT